VVRAWSVTARGISSGGPTPGLASVQVKGRNWIVALGRGLHELGRDEALQRLACEVLANGTVIARDITTGVGYVVQSVDTSDVASPIFELPDDQTSELPMGEAVEDGLETTADAVPDREDPAREGPGRRVASLAPLAEPLRTSDEPRTDELRTDETEELEEMDGEPIFMLPSDAIADLTTEDDPGYAILDADTRLEACRLALASARTSVGAESGAVILEERGALRFFAVDGPHAAKLIGSRLPLGTGVAGFAMENRRSVVLADAQSDPRHCGEVDALTGYETKQIAVVPIVARERALGVLELMNLPAGRRFAESDLSLARQFADALAVRLSR
jgi:GAF domain-containing protein